jgi:hypothetical protein
MSAREARGKVTFHVEQFFGPFAVLEARGYLP